MAARTSSGSPITRNTRSEARHVQAQRQGPAHHALRRAGPQVPLRSARDELRAVPQVPQRRVHVHGPPENDRRRSTRALPMKKRLITCCGTCPFADDGTDNDGKRATVWTCHGEYDENGWPKELGGAGGGTYPPVAPPDWCV